MKKMMAVSLFLFSASALAIPNIWTSGFGQGFIEYGISNDTGVTVVVACNVGADRRIMKIQSITVLIFRPVIMKWKGRLNF